MLPIIISVTIKHKKYEGKNWDIRFLPKAQLAYLQILSCKGQFYKLLINCSRCSSNFNLVCMEKGGAGMLRIHCSLTPDPGATSTQASPLISISVKNLLMLLKYELS